MNATARVLTCCLAAAALTLRRMHAMTLHAITGLAKRVKARILFTSTSEVYGDPEEHPQRETYWGHVNPIGPRACYDEVFASPCVVVRGLCL